MANNNCSNIVESLLKGMETIVSSKTVVGEPTVVGDVIILPLVDISFGIGAGASLNDHGSNGGGGGMNGKLSPNSVLIIKNGSARLVNIKNQDSVSKALDLIPEVVDKISDIINKKSMPSDDEAKDIAFPEE